MLAQQNSRSISYGETGMLPANVAPQWSWRCPVPRAQGLPYTAHSSNSATPLVGSFDL